MGKFKITSYELSGNGKIPKGGSIRLVFLSDLHNREFDPGNVALIRAVEKEKPNAVLIGGDHIVAKPGADMEAGLSLAAQLSEEFPVYYACGNHEYRLKLYPEVYGDAYQRFRERLADTNIVYLENAAVDTVLNGCPVRICGFEMPKQYFARFYRGTLPVTELTEVFGRAEKQRYTILMAHHPGYQDTYREFGADLTLSGHYHGGVVGLGRHHGLISPDFRLFPGCCRGLFDLGGKFQIVSAGIGEHTIPFRFGNPREMITITVS